MIKIKIPLRRNEFCKSILFALGLAWLTSYCASPLPNSTPTLTEQTSTPILSTVTPTATQILPTRTPLPLPTRLWTPLPTYLPNERSNIVMGLYENPPCRLPCWWGVTPGETDWNDAWQVLEPFASNRAPDELYFYPLLSKELPDYRLFQVMLDVPKDPNYGYYPFILDKLIFFVPQDATLVKHITVNTGNVEPYTIPKILATYGQPRQVYIQADVHQRPERNFIQAFLYYPQHGFMSTHVTTVEIEAWENDELTACFQKFTQLTLWAKGEEGDMRFILLDNYDGMERYRSGRTPYQPIEDVSDFTTAKFFNAFSGTSGKVCLNLITANLDK